MVDTFTPEQIAQILEEFFKVVGTRKYIGERYVPIFGRKGEDSIEWDNSAPYEPLTIVLYQGDSYTSRQYVPIGVNITNQEFWALTGNYNAQIEQYHRGTIAAFETVADMQAATDLLAGMTCHTNGFHAAGDGGAAYYIVSASGTANGMDVLALQGGLKATLVVTEPYVTPEQFGAYGDGTHNDASVIQAVIDYAALESLDVEFGCSKTYYAGSGITIGEVNVSMNSPLLYTGSGTAITIGSKTSTISKHAYKVWVTSDNTEYVSDSIGLQVYNASNCIFDIHIISGFEYGAIYSGYDAGFGYNQITTNLIRNCMYSITLRSDGTSGWCNENMFDGGRLSVVSGATYASSFVGITIDSDHAYLCNSNTFRKLSIEKAAVCIHVVYGIHNEFESIRTESATLAFKDENNSNWNHVSITYGNTGSETVGPLDVVEGHLARQILCTPVFDSGFMPSYCFSNDNWLFTGKDACYMDTTGTLKSVYKGVKYNDYIDITSRNIGVMVDTSIAKRFCVSGKPYNGSNWRVFVICYDSDGNYISTGVKSNQSRPLTIYTNVIGSIPVWRNGSNISDSTFFEVPETCVKAFMGLINATSVCGFNVFTDIPYVSIMGNQIDNGLSTIPTCEGKTGDFCPSSAANSVLGWLYNGTSWVAIS